MFRTERQLCITEAIAVHISSDVTRDPVGRELGIGPCSHDSLVVVGHGAFIREHPGVVLRQTQFLGVAMALGSGQLRQLSPPAFPLLNTHLDRPKVRIGEIAIVAGALLTAHALGELLAFIPEAGLLHHRLTRFVSLDLTLNLKLAGFLNRREGVHVLDLHLGTEGSIRPAAHGDVHVATQGTLLHVSVTHPQITHDSADFGGIFRRFPAGAEIRLAHDLSQGHTRSVVVHQ